MKTNYKKLKKYIRFILYILLAVGVAFGIYWLVTNWDSFFHKEELPTIPTQGDIEVTYFLNDQEYMKQYYSEGDTLQLLDYPQIAEKEVFRGWLTKEDKTVNNRTKVEENLNLYGYIINSIDYEARDYSTLHGVLDKYTGSETNVIIPSSYSFFKKVPVEGNDHIVTKLGDYMFRNNEELQSVHIPYGVVEIDDTAFSGCTNLNTIFVDSAIVYQKLTIEDNIGKLLDYTPVIYILATADNGTNSYLNGNFKKEAVEVNNISYILYTITDKTEFVVKFYDHTGEIEIRTYINGDLISTFPEILLSYEVKNITSGATTTYNFQYWADSITNCIITEETTVTQNMLIYAIYKAETTKPVKPPVSQL